MPVSTGGCRLLESGLSPDDLIYYGLEYKFVTLYLTGQMSYDEMHAELRRDAGQAGHRHPPVRKTADDLVQGHGAPRHPHRLGVSLIMFSGTNISL